MAEKMDKETDDRNDKGQFLPGWKGGPGRPRAEREAHYLDILLQECPPDAWSAIVRRAMLDAANGDHKAREWLGRYLLPKPGEEPGADNSKPKGLSRGNVVIYQPGALGTDIPQKGPVFYLPDNGRGGYGSQPE